MKQNPTFGCRQKGFPKDHLEINTRLEFKKAICWDIKRFCAKKNVECEVANRRDWP